MSLFGARLSLPDASAKVASSREQRSLILDSVAFPSCPQADLYGRMGLMGSTRMAIGFGVSRRIGVG